MTGFLQINFQSGLSTEMPEQKKKARKRRPRDWSFSSSEAWNGVIATRGRSSLHTRTFYVI